MKINAIYKIIDHAQKIRKRMIYFKGTIIELIVLMREAKLISMSDSIQLLHKTRYKNCEESLQTISRVPIKSASYIIFSYVEICNSSTIRTAFVLIKNNNME